eukprot:GEMP01101897.1.p1 GENE.GEMP01101897.1~~GEMP01101897.1.p1  ORF type:complete len:143 (+),score=32.38 GEMP01101897.1:111-539(+)
MTAVTVHYLSGDPLHLDDCATVGSLMVQVAILHQRFASDVAVVCPDTGKDLTKPHTQVPPPTVSIVLKQEECPPSADDLHLALLLHAEREDTETCARALHNLRQFHPLASTDDILLRALDDCDARKFIYRRGGERACRIKGR